MYLFPESEIEPSLERIRSRSRRNFFPRTPADEEADHLIDRALQQFREERPSYDPNITLLEEDRWGSTLWPIAAATHLARSEIMPRGYSDSAQPPLDALGVELIRKCFIEAFGLRGGSFQKEVFEQGALLRVKKLVPISLDEMISSINHWEWSSRPRKGRYTREWSFLLEFGGRRPERLTFTADLKTETEKPRVEGEVARISAVRISGVKKEGAAGDGPRAIQRTLRGILRDQNRRSTLADRYSSTPETVALAEPLQKLFLQILETADTKPPVSALSGFAFGRFPFDRMRYSSSSVDLVLVRGCTHCRYPTKIVLEENAQKPNRTQRKAAAQIGNEILTPWHSEVCGKSPEDLWRRKRLKDEGYGPKRIDAEPSTLYSSRSKR